MVSYKLTNTKKERLRCLDIVQNKRSELTHKLLHGDLSRIQKTYIRRVINLLRDLENEIRGDTDNNKDVIEQPQGDFTVDEIERARQIVDELQKELQNPFEKENIK
jgi:hypothetical protein